MSQDEALGVAANEDRYCSNTELYQDPSLVEGVDYARRYRRHERFDDDPATRLEPVRSAIIAPHGGGIEPGTSELCLAVAGYDPASLQVTPAGGVTYDYWMFEGLRSIGNGELHVTSTHCDDGVALSLCGGSLNALGLHGCTPQRAKLSPGTQAVLVGGGNEAFKRLLLVELEQAGFRAIDGADRGEINGDDPRNIINRTLLCMGGHLELTTPLREAMFDDDRHEHRKDTLTQVFHDFVAACRGALAQLEARQPIL